MQPSKKEGAVTLASSFPSKPFRFMHVLHKLLKTVAPISLLSKKLVTAGFCCWHYYSTDHSACNLVGESTQRELLLS